MELDLAVVRNKCNVEDLTVVLDDRLADRNHVNLLENKKN